MVILDVEMGRSRLPALWELQGAGGRLLKVVNTINMRENKLV
jgi:hypothetical protein